MVRYKMFSDIAQKNTSKMCIQVLGKIALFFCGSVIKAFWNGQSRLFFHSLNESARIFMLNFDLTLAFSIDTKSMGIKIFVKMLILYQLSRNTNCFQLHSFVLAILWMVATLLTIIAWLLTRHLQQFLLWFKFLRTYASFNHIFSPFNPLYFFWFFVKFLCISFQCGKMNDWRKDVHAMEHQCRNHGLNWVKAQREQPQLSLTDWHIGDAFFFNFCCCCCCFVVVGTVMILRLILPPLIFNTNVRLMGYCLKPKLKPPNNDESVRIWWMWIEILFDLCSNSGRN